jgi:hypothetical protein
LQAIKEAMAAASIKKGEFLQRGSSFQDEPPLLVQRYNGTTAGQGYLEVGWDSHANYPLRAWGSGGRGEPMQTIKEAMAASPKKGKFVQRGSSFRYQQWQKGDPYTLWGLNYLMDFKRRLIDIGKIGFCQNKLKRIFFYGI